MSVVKRFSKATIESIHKSKILGIRCGNDHKFTGVWVVVANDRVFIRSWNDKPTGWYRAFLENPRGTISLSGREIDVRARKVRGGHLLDSIDEAYGEKYNTAASRKYVGGFAQTRRRINTLEFTPL